VIGNCLFLDKHFDHLYPKRAWQSAPAAGTAFRQQQLMLLDSAIAALEAELDLLTNGLEAGLVRPPRPHGRETLRMSRRADALNEEDADLK
jgi:hypothetical protein